MDKFGLAFGGKRPQELGAGDIAPQPQAKLSPQEQMMMNLLKQFIPGFDLSVIQTLGEDIQNTVAFFREETTKLHLENAETQRLLRLQLQAQGIDPDAHSQPLNDGGIQTSIYDHYSRG